MRQTRDRIQVSYWFIPLVAAVLAVFLSYLSLWADARIPNAAPGTFGLLHLNSLTTARAALLGMAATLLTTTGVVFSLLMVPLSVAVAQFGSRLLRIYLKDRLTQTVLGVFVGAFVYSLSLALIMPTDDRMMEGPEISISLALLLSLTAFATMLVLIHHIAVFLQAPNLVAAAGQELRAVIHAYAPTEPDPSGQLSYPIDSRMVEDGLLKRIEDEGKPIIARNLGYIQDIDPKMVPLLSKYPDLVVHLVRKPGDFIHPGDLIARVWPPEVTDARVLQHVQDAYRLGNSRSPTQDIGYGINQLVEVALRAMSPAINDPFTAMTCLDHIGAGLALYAERHPNQALFYDAQHKLRVILDPVTFGELLDAAFSMLRRAGRENAEVLLTMLNTIGVVGQKASLPEQRAELAHQVRLIDMENLASSCVAADKERVSRRCAELLAMFVTDFEVLRRSP